MRVGLIPVAGKGLRFKDLGKQYPKSILPYQGVPIIVHNINWLKDHGCEEIRITVGHQGDKIKETVKHYFPEDNIKFFQLENLDLGLSASLDMALSDELTETLIVLGDLIVTDGIPETEFEHNFISVKKVDDYSRWCLVKMENDSQVVSKFIDKPKTQPDTNLAVSGVYFFLNGSLLKEKIQTQLKSENVGEYQLSGAMSKIDDIHTISVQIKDFGTLKEYLENKGLRNSRNFNDVTVDDIFIEKKSSQARKMIAEINWYKNLPEDLKLMTPQILSYNLYSGKYVSYKMERIFSPTLREIYLYLDSSEETWKDIFNKIFHTLESMANYESPEEPVFMDEMIQKTHSRVDDIQFTINTGTIHKFMIDLENTKEKLEDGDVLIHGDFCFSNILYDIQMNRVKIIDPRGQLFGSRYYDVAKVCHSVLYDYDYIDSELYSVLDDSHFIYDDGKDSIKKLFRKELALRYDEEELAYIELITASLFLSMIPLHSHNEENQKLYYKKFEEIYSNYRRTYGK